MTTRAQMCAFFGAAALCAPIAGCGDEDVGDPIPSGRAADLEAQLDTVRDLADQKLCEEAADRVEEARATVDALDDEGVGSDVQDALGDGVDNLSSLISQECAEEVETVPETTPETTPTTETTETETTETETTETETTETETTETEPFEPDEEGGGGQFDPNADLPPGQGKKLEED